MMVEFQIIMKIMLYLHNYLYKNKFVIIYIMCYRAEIKFIIFIIISIIIVLVVVVVVVPVVVVVYTVWNGAVSEIKIRIPVSSAPLLCVTKRFRM